VSEAANPAVSDQPKKTFGAITAGIKAKTASGGSKKISHDYLQAEGSCFEAAARNKRV
jgi:hypothetical protein